MALSEFTISKAKPQEKAYKLADGGGLFLLVKTNGSKLWLRIPEYSATYSDSIRPPIPGYPATFDTLL